MKIKDIVTEISSITTTKKVLIVPSGNITRNAEKFMAQVP